MPLVCNRSEIPSVPRLAAYLTSYLLWPEMHCTQRRFFRIGMLDGLSIGIFAGGFALRSEFGARCAHHADVEQYRNYRYLLAGGLSL